MARKPMGQRFQELSGPVLGKEFTMGLGLGAAPKGLHDNYGRQIPYRRLFIPDVCKFKCSYCLPNGCQGSPRAGFLKPDEIGRLVDTFCKPGTHKIRITGSETGMSLRHFLVDGKTRLTPNPASLGG